MKSLRTRACAVLALVGALLAVAATPAHAEVSPTGAVTIHAHLTMHITVFDAPETFSVDGTLKATVGTQGQLSIKKSDVKINPVLNVTFAQGQVVVPKISFSAPADWNGGIDPKSGLMTLSGPLVFTVEVSAPVPASGCPIGPIVMNFSTAKSGGKAYDAQTGAAKVFDDEYTLERMPDVPAGQVPGCGGAEGVFNNALGLPLQPHQSSTTLDLTFDPILTGDGSTTPVTLSGPTTTTTVAPTTTTVAVKAQELPRTGSSSTPLAIVGAAFVATGATVLVRRRRTAA